MDSPGPREDMDQLTVRATSAPGVVWIIVGGEVDLANHEQLRRSLAVVDLGRASLVYVDLRLLSFCDSAGCQVLLRFEKRARDAGCDVRMHRPQPIVRKVMAILAGLAALDQVR